MGLFDQKGKGGAKSGGRGNTASKNRGAKKSGAPKRKRS
jgi:hypothetical protein